MSDGLLDKLKGVFQGVFLTHVPDHLAHGGNTGDTEWNPDGEDDETPETEPDDQLDSR